MEPGSKGKAPVCQGLPHLLTVPARQPEGQHPRLPRPPEDLHPRDGGQSLPRPAAEGALMLPDALLAGATRLAAVLPGLSPLGLTLAVCRLRDLRTDFALRFTAMLALGFSLCEFVYRLLRAVIVGTFSASLWLPMLVALVASTLAGYFALQYLKYLLHREKLRVFSYYCWDAAVIALILALINA